MAKPFLKWAGGKRGQLGRLMPLIGEPVTYVEPFLGGGAVFFELLALGRIPKRVVLSDLNQELINCYRVVRDSPDELIALLSPMRYDRALYYKIRAAPATMDVAGAARTIYLNKTGFNGLYRLNRSGAFNVPFGRYASPKVCNEDVIRSASIALAGVELRAADFTEVLADDDLIGPESTVYLDPPYMPVSGTSFTAYTAEDFGPLEHELLAQLFGRASARGARLILSQADVPLAHLAYGGCGYDIRSTRVARAINSKASGRGLVGELIITSNL